MAPWALASSRGTTGFVAGLHYSGRRDLLLGVLGGVTTGGASPAHSKQQAMTTVPYFF